MCQNLSWQSEDVMVTLELLQTGVMEILILVERLFPPVSYFLNLCLKFSHKKKLFL